MNGYYIGDKYYPVWTKDDNEERWSSDNLEIWKCDDDPEHDHFHWQIWGYSHTTSKTVPVMRGTEDNFDEASKICAEMVNAMSELEEPHEPIVKSRLN